MSEERDSEQVVHKVEKFKCTMCGHIVDKKGRYVHYTNKHREIGNWEDIKDSLLSK